MPSVTCQRARSERGGAECELRPLGPCLWGFTSPLSAPNAKLKRNVLISGVSSDRSLDPTWSRFSKCKAGRVGSLAPRCTVAERWWDCKG